MMSQCLGEDIAGGPACFLLHQNKIPLQKYRDSLLVHMANAARKCIPLKWKSGEPPSVGMWMKIM